MILFRFVSYKPTSVSLICNFHQNSCMEGTLAQDSTTQLQRWGSWKRVIMLVKFLWIYSLLGYNFTSQDASIINTQVNFKQTEVCKHHHKSWFRTVPPPQCLPCACLQPIPLRSSEQDNPLPVFLSLYVCLFWTFQTIESQNRWSSGPNFFNLADCFEVHLYYCMYQ